MHYCCRKCASFEPMTDSKKTNPKKAPAKKKSATAKKPSTEKQPTKKPAKKASSVTVNDAESSLRNAIGETNTTSIAPVSTGRHASVAGESKVRAFFRKFFGL